ncbi:ATP-dependent DNA helicase [Congregibacter litoralis]|uniref:ATP-dependent exoDNAse (Exonuclease V), alpha subunit-helicase superfamily I member n=1 Tax=Congregibacter litoralis KT71 TaxID=314285 RepID=A4AC13_9GAMM|nr:ATP-dependent RecD-like DNA helicase [Congregibacter litoralis]EAQ96463.1 ATP-dependent exoDNAse (exonuclease V), alpha subunit - helicase superfamily I member [Congregibacter litoralis KT71]
MTAIQFSGVVGAIWSESEARGAIIRLDDVQQWRGRRISVRIPRKVCFKLPSIGEIWTVSGNLETSDFGDQLVADAAYQGHPEGQQVVEFLAKNPRFAGVGKAIAKRLWDRWGDDLYSVLDDADFEMIAIEMKLPMPLAANMVDQWKESRIEVQVLRNLQALKLPPKIANQAIRFWGEKAVEKIKENPYRLLPFSSWAAIDNVARAAYSMQSFDPRRLVAMTEAVLYKHLDQGNTAVPINTLVAGVQKIDPLVNAHEAIDLAVSDGTCVVHEEQAQILGCKVIEDGILNRMSRLLQTPRRNRGLFSGAPIIQSEQPIFAGNLTEEQQTAALVFLENRFGVLLGGAGMGKTTLLRYVYSQLPAEEVIVQLALTNKAANRMRESTGRYACSIAAFLGRADDNQLPSYFSVFVDEASMLDAIMIYRIFLAMPEDANLYLIGDHHQLPPIGPGLILHKFAETECGFVTRLTKVMRQSEESGIPGVAAEIRNQTPPNLVPFDSGLSQFNGVFSRWCTQSQFLHDALATWRELKTHGQTQIVAATRSIVSAINTSLHIEHVQALASNGESIQTINIKDGSVAVGEPVIYLRNNAQRQLFNGLIGRVVEVSADNGAGESVMVQFDDIDSPHELASDDLQDLSLAYAITCHKAQGSQWQYIVVVSGFSKTAPRIADNSWWYTAVTRCEQACVIVGSKEGFDKSVAAPPRSFARTTGFRLHCLEAA